MRSTSSSRTPPRSSDPAAVRAELDRLRRRRDRIQALFRDVEAFGVDDSSAAGLHLRELRGVLLDADDVVDEWDYELLRAEVEGGAANHHHKRKRGGAAATNLLAGDAVLRDRMARQIAEVVSRYEEITDQNSAFRLGKELAAPGGRSGSSPSSSLVDERYVFDGDDYKDSLVEYMVSDDRAGSGLAVIPIVGMGLVGKTTLAQLIYDDPLVVQHFDLGGWVSLTGWDSDVRSLFQRIVESLTSQPCDCQHLGTIQQILQRCVAGKRFLLVFDDVSREILSIWEQFKASIWCGLSGSVVIITTKIGEVAQRTRTVQECYLYEGASDEGCWRLFEKYASASGLDALQGPKLVRIRKKVAEICGGMPPVAKMLGISFCEQYNKESWVDSMEYIVEEKILPKLRSSYEVLPGDLKPCLLYCALFPKGSLFDMERLVRLWMAQGLIQPPKNRKLLEDLGIQYFNELVSRSFFLPSETGKELYYMPNLICYLLYSISRGEHGRVEDMSNLPSEARHLSLVSKSIPQCESFYKYTSLRSFLVMPTFPYTSILHLEIQDEMFHQLNHLRSLDLSYTDLEILPDSVGYLKHLRFLALNHTRIKRLPESIHMLYNLQTLELKSCPWLKELPRGIGSLINLRHLDVDSDYLLVHMPFQIQRLTSLQKLPTFDLQKGNEIHGIVELQDLTNLAELCISGLCNVTNLGDAKKANMQNKVHLKTLKLIWPSNDALPDHELSSECDPQNFLNLADEVFEEDVMDVHDLNNARGSGGKLFPTHEKPSSHDADDELERLMDIPDEQESNLSSIQLRDGINNMGIQDSVLSDAAVNEVDLLESLRPTASIEMLCIKSYGGPRFPDWLGASSFSKLIGIELIDCKCVILPPLGQLPYLKFLSIDGTSVELIGTDFCGTGNANAFPKVETLYFHNMNNWEKWDGVKVGDFPNLNKLCLFNCPQLRRLPDHFSSLEVLEVERCMELIGIPNLPSLLVLHLCCCDGLTTLPTALPSLSSLTIMYCQKLESLPPLRMLENLWIEDCGLLPSVLPKT